MIRHFLWGALALLATVSAQAQTITPQGRLSLTSATPVQTADVSAATTIYYACYNGNTVPVNGSNLTIGSCNASMGLDTTNHVSGKNYDIFAVSSSGMKLCTGPAWSSDTSRGTGAGTTEIAQDSNGLWTNANSLTHCYGGASGTTDYGTVSANAGTYLGSFRTTANGQTTHQFAPTAAAGGANTILGLYNAYNRTLARAFSQDNTGSWTYNSTTWRAANNSNSNRINWLDGLNQSRVIGSYVAQVAAAGGSNFGVQVAVNFNSTSATPSGVLGEIGVPSASTFNVAAAGGDMTTALGYNYLQAMEKVRGGTGTYFCSTIATSCMLSLEYMN